MKILFEEYAYKRDKVEYILPDKDPNIQYLNQDMVSIPYVGYYYSSKVNDSVFVLPKVFINEISPKVEKAFGEFDPTEIIDLNAKDNPLKGTDYETHIFNLSAWIYRAIEIYRERKVKENNAYMVDVLDVDSSYGDKSHTLINIVLELIRFNKEHQHLFTFIAKLSSQGRHKINWQKTISRRQPVIIGDVPLYMSTITREKKVNYDEELILLFFSVLDYLHGKYHFHVIRNLNYPTNKRLVESLISSGKGSRLLRNLRHKYFKDELVRLWNLLYVFFRREEDMKSKRVSQEYLMVRNFNLVFEDMIDSLITDDTKKKDKKMSDQRDGKIVDHIYKYQSLVRRDDIYYIGDSKYYKEGSNPQDPSIYKQFTYAKNVIQRNMDMLTPEDNKIYRDNYFDPITEGYNVTPNFFIRGTVVKEGKIDDYKLKFRLDQTIVKGVHDVDRLRHHVDRLFDRDTLLVLKYNISFLYVLSSYASCHIDENIRRKIRDTFRMHVMRQLDKDYKFFKLRALEGIEKNAALDKHFKLLIGKVFSAFDGRDERAVLMALERASCDAVVHDIYHKIKNEFEIIDYDLIEDKEGVVYKEPSIFFMQNLVQGELQFVEDGEDKEEVLDYEILDDVDDVEKYVNFLPVFTIQAVCGDFEDAQIPEPIGWVKASGLGFKLSNNLFVIRAKGRSMLPMINENDLCVFERYWNNGGGGGSRNGEIVLAECRYYDPDYSGRYTIKKYKSEWKEYEDGTREQIQIELIPLNRDGYDVITLDTDRLPIIRGILKHVIHTVS